MSQQDDVILALGATVENLLQRVDQLEEALTSLQKGLIAAFREAGYDFTKIGQTVSSRNTAGQIQAAANVMLNPEDIDPALQDELARKILKEESDWEKLQKDPRALLNEASNKGRKE